MCGLHEQDNASSIHNYYRDGHAQLQCFHQSVIAYMLRPFQGDVVLNLSKFVHSEISPSVRGHTTEKGGSCHLLHCSAEFATAEDQNVRFLTFGVVTPIPTRIVQPMQEGKQNLK